MLPLLERSVALFSEGAVAQGLVAAESAPGVLSEMLKQAVAPGVNRTAMTLTVLDRAHKTYVDLGDKTGMANVLKTRGLVDSLLGEFHVAFQRFRNVTVPACPPRSV